MEKRVIVNNSFRWSEDGKNGIRSMEISVNDASLSVIVDEQTGELKIRANSDGFEHTGRLLVVPLAPNSLIVKLEEKINDN